MKLYTSPLPLRDYQKVVRDKMDLAAENSVVVMPTGTGKTRVITDYVFQQLDQNKVILIVVSTIELLKNIEESIAMVNPTVIKFFYSPISSKTGKFTPCKRLYIGTYGSVLKAYPKMLYKPDIIIHDECHHAKSKTWEQIAKFSGLHFGFTATPIRLDGRPLKDLFPGIITTGKNVDWFIQNGYLSPFRVQTTFTIDFERSIGFDNLGLQSKAFDNKRLIGDAVTEWKKHAEGKRTVVFTTTNEHSEHVLDAYKAAGVSAAVIDGKMAYKAREQVLNDFRSGVVTVLINVAIVTEGVDVPDAECVQLLRFTQSTTLYLQMVGRVLRPKENKVALILDHAGNVEYHLMPDTPIDWEEMYSNEFLLEDFVKKNDSRVKCKVCGHVLFEHIKLQPFEQEFQVCPECGYNNVLKVRRKRELIKTDKFKELKEIKMSPIEGVILKIFGEPITQQRKRSKILNLFEVYPKNSADLKKAMYILYDAKTPDRKRFVDNLIGSKK